MLRIVLWVVAAVIAITVVMLFWAYNQSERAADYVSESTRAIYTDWNFGEVERRADEHLRATRGFVTETSRGFGILRNGLGKMTHADEPHGDSGVSLSLLDASRPAGAYRRYTVAAQFERGTATLRMMVSRPGGEWHIAGFNVESKFDAPAAANAQRTSARRGALLSCSPWRLRCQGTF
jgi:hypothetical protein